MVGYERMKILGHPTHNVHSLVFGLCVSLLKKGTAEFKRCMGIGQFFQIYNGDMYFNVSTVHN